MHIASTETISMTLTYGVSTPRKRAERKGAIVLSWTIQDPNLDFGGFVLVASQHRPPEDRQDGEVLYRWTPEQAVKAGEHKALVSLEPVENKGWDHFYCKAFVARPEQDSSTLIVHPNTCIPFTSEGEVEMSHAPPIENGYTPGIPRTLVCPDPECLESFATIDMQFSDFKGAEPCPGNYNWLDRLWCLLGGRLKRIKPPIGNDGSLMAQKLCPKGHTLPINAGLNDSLIINVIGGVHSGKTHFITSLIYQLHRQTAEDLKAALMGLTDATNRRYRDELYSALFGNRVALPITVGKAAPLIYHLTLNVKGSKRFGIRSVNLILYDCSGGGSVYPHSVRTLPGYLELSSGIFLIVDPLAIQDVRNRLPPRIVEPWGEIEEQDLPNVLIANVLGLLEGGRAVWTDKPLSLPLAVVITKCDLLADYGLITANRLWSTDRRHIGCFDTQLHEDLAGMWGEFMLRWAPAIYNCVNLRFPNHAFFGVSATGCNADETGRYPFVSPWRVEDPLLWLLAKSGFLPAQ